MTSNLTLLATAMKLSPAEAVALPTCIEVAARKVGLSQPALVSQAIYNVPLRDYLAGVCRSVTQ
jgi:hypothetical protein